jgi:hypothetical protein
VQKVVPGEGDEQMDLRAMKVAKFVREKLEESREEIRLPCRPFVKMEVGGCAEQHLPQRPCEWKIVHVLYRR